MATTRSEPRAALQISADILLIAGSAPLHMQEDLPTRDAADKFLEASMKRLTAGLDANDFLYAVSASRNYDPSPRLDAIKAPVMFINSAETSSTLLKWGLQNAKSGE